MDRTMKIFFIFCFTVFFFTGCKQNDSKGQVSGPTGAGKNSKGQQQKLDAEATQVVSSTLQALSEMHGVFQQMFPLVTNSKGVKPPPSVFQVLGYRLVQSNVVQTTQTAAPVVKQPTPTTPTKTGKPIAKDLNRATPTAACEGSKSAVKIEPAESDGQKYRIYSLVFLDCRNPKADVILAKWVFGSQGDMTLQFNVSALSVSPNNAYGQMAEFAKGKSSSCNVQYDLNKKEVRKFSCENLGQDYKLANEATTSKGVFFEKIEFDRAAAKPLKVHGTLINMATVPPSSLKVVAEDDPSLNEFKVETYPLITGSDDGSTENVNTNVTDQLQPPPPPSGAEPTTDPAKTNDSGKEGKPADENEVKNGDTSVSPTPGADATQPGHQPADPNAKSSPDGNSEQRPPQHEQQPNANPQDPAADPAQTEGANPPPQAMT